MLRRLDSLGRVVIPVEIRRQLMISPGDGLFMTMIEDGFQVRKYKELENINRNLEFLDEIVQIHFEELGEVHAAEIRKHIKAIQALFKGKALR